MLRSGANEEDRNGVGIVGHTIQRTEGRPDQCLISVIRKSDPVMSIELGLEQMVVNIMCAYVPQVGCVENET